MTEHQAFEFDQWFDSDVTLPIDGEAVWVRGIGDVVRAAVFVEGGAGSTRPPRFVIESGEAAGDLFGRVAWQPRTTVIL